MEDGFIYVLTRALIRLLNGLNAVEWLKRFAGTLVPRGATKEVRNAYRNVAIDVFIVLKWAAVACFWTFWVGNLAARAVTYYLIAANAYSYFYHHVWEENPYRRKLTIDRSRRRFVNLILAVAFSCFSYAYLYRVVYPAHFEWSGETSRALAAIHYSLTSSFGGAFDGAKPISDAGSVLVASQQLGTFVFIAIIVSKSIPAPEEK